MTPTPSLVLTYLLDRRTGLGPSSPPDLVPDLVEEVSEGAGRVGSVGCAAGGRT